MNEFRTPRRHVVPHPSWHLPEETLEAVAEGGLPPGDRSEAAAHLAACSRCAAEIEAYRSLFAALSTLPRFAPPVAFTDAVMARVTLPQPILQVDRLAEWLPSTRRGWSIFTLAALVPTILVVMLLGWLLSWSPVAPTLLVPWGIERVRQIAAVGLSGANGWVLDSGVLDQLWSFVEPLTGIPMGTLSVLAVLFAVAIPLSAWSLLHLTRTPLRKVSHA